MTASRTAKTAGYTARASAEQQRIWTLHESSPEDAAFNTSLILRLTGRLDACALETALRDVIRRHDILRTRFEWRDGLVQVVDSESDLFIDTINIPADDPADSVAVLADAARAPFELAYDHPIRVALLPQGSEVHYLGITTHHIAFDGWSTGIFLEELAQRYSDAEQGSAPGYAGSALQYSDYADWQQQELASGRFASGLDFWREALTGSSSTVFFRPSDVARSESGVVTVRETLRQEVLEKLRAQTNVGVSDAMIVLALLGAVIRRRALDDDVAIALPVNLRDLPELESLIGSLVNIVIARLRISNQTSFRDLLAHTRRVLLDALRHQHVPFDEVVRAIKPDRRIGHHPFSDVFFNFTSHKDSPPQFSGLVCDFVDGPAPGQPTALELYVGSSGADAELTLAYRPDLVAGEFAERMVSHLVEFAHRASNDPTLAIDALSVKPYRAGKPLLQSDAVNPTMRVDAAERDAVSLGSDRWSWRTIWTAAMRVARSIDERVGCGSSIAIVATPSAEFVAAVIATSLRGHATVIVDARDHADGSELEKRLRDQGVEVIVDAASGIFRRSEAAVVVSAAEALRRPTSDCDFSAAGKVMGSFHIDGEGSWRLGTSELVEAAEWQRDAYGVTADDRIAMVAPLESELSVLNVFLAARVGATLLLPPTDLVPADLAGWLEHTDATIIQSTPSAVLGWLATTESARGSRVPLRLVFLWGETLYGAVVRQLRMKAHEAKIVNVYSHRHEGPLAAFDIDAHSAMEPVIPIGRELRAGGLIIVSSSGRVCAPDEIGELIVVHPDRSEHATRDLGRRRGDGTIELIGKRSAHGAEPSLLETEATLASSPGVGATAVDWAEGHIHAYVVPSEICDIDHVLHNARRQLPSRYAPKGITAIRALPIDRRGRLDRAALHLPIRSEKKFAYARNATEELVVTIWADVLNEARVSVDDDFFALGGTSFQLARVAAAIELARGVKLPLNMLFESRRASDLARAIEESSSAGARDNTDWPSLVPLQGVRSESPFFCVHEVSGSCLPYVLLARRAGDLPFVGVEAPSAELQERTVASIATNYAAQISRYQPSGAITLGGWSFGGTIAFETARRLNEQLGRRIERLILLDAYAPSSDPHALMNRRRGLIEQLANSLSQAGREHELLAERLLIHLSWDRLLDVDRTDLAAVMRLVVAHNTALDSYEPTPFKTSTTLFLAGREQGREDLVERWRSLTSDVEVIEIDCDHHSMLAEPAVRQLARNLVAVLGKKGSPA